MDIVLGVSAEFVTPGIGHTEQVLIVFKCNLLVELASEAEVAVDDAEGRLVVTELNRGRAILRTVEVIVAVVTFVSRGDRGGCRNYE